MNEFRLTWTAPRLVPVSSLDLAEAGQFNFAVESAQWCNDVTYAPASPV